MSALPPKADIVQHGGNVRFVPTADIAPRHSITPSARSRNEEGTCSMSLALSLRAIARSNRKASLIEVFTCFTTIRRAKARSCDTAIKHFLRRERFRLLRFGHGVLEIVYPDRSVQTPVPPPQPTD